MIDHQQKVSIWFQGLCRAFATIGFVILVGMIVSLTLSGAHMAERHGGRGVETAAKGFSQRTSGRLSSVLAVPQTLSVGRGAARSDRSFSVSIFCNSAKTVVTVDGGDVEDALAEAGMILGPMDLVEPPLDRRLEPGDEITVTQQEYVTAQKQVELPHAVQAIPTSLLAEGSSRVLVEGKPGLQLETYGQVIVDGTPQKKQLLETEMIEEPVTEYVLVGTPQHPISQLDFGCELDENGEPVSYAKVLRDQPAAGYSARPGSKTASGREAVVGHVAVDPNLIPYGTKLYIKSSDGGFVYGYAVAADTGTAIRQGRITVDLFYGTYAESKLNGIKSVDIFLL